ncbi:hypothetical protein ATK30_0170 [Amycolatopsis echigonensis]|uniref:Uncharacterized protein n=1 Tax=Amycolatopsis echigonensis TaxID=2576905 RepID=A0A2N3X1U5_9PSEU|nr:hypothetical protein [Amycolatopsis niigatensis]PKW00094.1 hypothetical protein ATK30_0170 [Amycolatopsis niigatensis]
MSTTMPFALDAGLGSAGLESTGLTLREGPAEVVGEIRANDATVLSVLREPLDARAST